MPTTRRTREDSPELLVAVVGGPLMASSPIEQDFARLYKDVHPHAIRFAKHLVSREVAEDVVNDVSLELWRHWKSLPLEAKRASYFLRRVFWRAMDHKKRDDRLLSLPEETEGQAEEGDAGGEYRYPTTLPAPLRVSEPDLGPNAESVIEEVVLRMPAQRRRVFQLLRDGFSYEEIAGTMRISEKTVSNHMTLAYRQLRKGAVRAGLHLESSQSRKSLPPAAPSRREEPDHG